MMGFTKFVFVLILYFSQNTQCESDYDGPSTINLYHNLEGWPCEHNWVQSAHITFQNVNSGNVDVELLNWNASASEKLLGLAKKDLIYIIKSVVLTSKGNEIVLRSFTKAKSLVLKNASTTLTFSLDHTGSVMSVNLQSTPQTPGDEDVAHLPVVKPTVILRPTELGPVPDTASYIQKVEREREAKERAVADNRSFLAKYWMYIFPLVVLALFTGSSSEQTQQGR